VEAGPLQPSGRVIASGRLLLACLFLVAIWADASQSTENILPIYGLLGLYVIWAATVTLLVWNDWWIDARLAGPAHVGDVAVFMLMLFSTAGYTSPYFTFFIFILLAAAIRWGWKETAVTGGAITAAYLIIGIVMGSEPGMEIEAFVLRTGHLLIISSILVWFGASQWVPWRHLESRGAVEGTHDGDGFIAALQAGMSAVGATGGVMLWRDAGGPEVEIVRISGGKATRSDVRRQTKWSTLPGSLLFNLPKNRVLMLGDAGRWRFLPAVGNLSDSFRKLIGVGEGLAVPIATGTIEGMAVFFEVRALSTDHLDVAPRVARELAVRIQDATLFAAVEERSMAKARVAVARDLHDSVVQFLAGLGFRLEALSRSPEAKGELAHGIADLKDTVMTEQRQLRAFIKGLRTGMPISMHDLTRDCSSLCKLLSRQWTIDCRCACGSETGFVPLRTQLDFQHLVREAVANAVRHGGAKHVTVAIHRDDDALNLTVTDDGRGFAPDKPAAPPASLNGRVREARGELKVESIEGRTSVIIRLPLERAE